MAVVAFPFTCIMGDELEEDTASQSPLLSFGSSSTNTKNDINRDSHHQQQQPESRMDDSAGHDYQQQDSDTASVPSLMEPTANESETEPVLQDETMIDDAFFGELEGDDDNDNTHRPTVGHDRQEVDAVVDDDVAMNDSLDTAVEDSQSIRTGHDDNDTLPVSLSLPTPTAAFGGLSNLGNTCYLNSALQMVASLDSFTEHLKNNPLPESPNSNQSDQNRSDEADPLPGRLRAAFLDVMESLAAGETVRPIEFKRLLDERTPLFVGFRQQDSHEFLTTLFDLLDEDYKVKPASPRAVASEAEADNVEDDTSSTTEADKAPVGPLEEGAEETKITSDTVQDAEENDEFARPETPQEEEKEEQEVKADDLMDNDDTFQAKTESYESATKRPRNVEALSVTTRSETSPFVASPTRVQSFTDLKPEGIEKLLHANLLVDNQIQNTAAAPSPPRCKLVGGRMAAHDNDHDMLLSDVDSDIATTSMCVACEESETEEAECSHISPVESYLKTEARVRLTCESCKYTRSHTESFFHLSLEIGSDNSSVADGLRKFFSPEKRELKCEKCFCETAIQTTEITRLPRALLLHFKRFIVDVSDDYTSITYRKNQSDVLFEDKLDLSEERGGVLAEFVADDVSMPMSDFDVDRHAYHIRSVVNHIGSSASCGHYTADAARLSPTNGTSEMADNQDDRQWKRFNDSYVTSISADDAIKESSRTAYMVMYELS